VTPNGPAATPRIGRRDLLRGAGLLGVLAAAGCTISDPRILGAGRGPAAASASPPPPPSPTPTLAGAEASADAETSVAVLASALLESTAKLSSGQRALVFAARDAHTLHAAVLRSTDPTARSGVDVPSTQTPAAPAKVSLDSLVSAEKSLAGRQGKLVEPSRGLTALLFGSLGVSASMFASALTSTGGVPITPTPTDPPTPVVIDDVAGTQAALNQVYALIYGYQVALGQIRSGKGHDRALAGLADRRALRDRLIRLLISRQAYVPAAEPAYVPSVRVHDASSAGQLLASMETAFLPFTGQWLAAAARAADVTLAWATMRATAALARSWGGPVAAWPGWPA
jgi:Domain of unknown function (DUF4439)